MRSPGSPHEGGVAISLIAIFILVLLALLSGCGEDRIAPVVQPTHTYYLSDFSYVDEDWELIGQPELGAFTLSLFPDGTLTAQGHWILNDLIIVDGVYGGIYATDGDQLQMAVANQHGEDAWLSVLQYTFSPDSLVGESNTEDWEFSVRFLPFIEG